MKNFPKHMDPTEAGVVSKLIGAALRARMTIRVQDGEEWATPWTNSRAVIEPEVAATDVTYLYLRDSAGERVGWIMLVHGNGADVIADFGWPASRPEHQDVLDGLCNEAMDHIAA